MAYKLNVTEHVNKLLDNIVYQLPYIVSKIPISVPSYLKK